MPTLTQQRQEIQFLEKKLRDTEQRERFLSACFLLLRVSLQHEGHAETTKLLEQLLTVVRGIEDRL